jgi:hypothetical protein
MMRAAKTAFGAVILGCLLLSGASAFGATAPTGGTIKVWITPSAGGGGTAVVTGAIGDYGKTSKINSAGYGKLVLKKGTILVNLGPFEAAQKAAMNEQPADYSPTTCSASVAFNAMVPVVSGTKAYVGITGSVTLNATFAFVLPTKKSGSCNTANNVNPIAQWVAITGLGTVNFS